MKAWVTRFHRTAFVVLLAYALLNIFSILFLKKMPAGLTALLAFIFFLFCARLSLVRVALNSLFQHSLAVFLLCWFALLIQILTQEEVFDFLGKSSYVFPSLMLLVSMFWFSAGAMVSGVELNKSNLFSLLLVALVLSSLLSSLSGGLLISYSDLAEAGAEGVDHLVLTEMLLLVGIVSYVLSQGFVKYFVLLCVAFFVFSGGGRSTFYFGIGSIVLYEIFFGKERVRVLIAVGVISVLAAAVMLSADDDLIHRMLFSEGLDGDGSFVERGQIFETGIAMLPGQFWYGNPGMIVSEFGVMGGYIHNLLSSWQFFGFFGFLAIGVLVLKVVSRARPVLLDCRSPIDELGAISLVYAILGIVFAKYVGFVFLWFALGFWVFRTNASFRRHLKARLN